MMRAWRRGGGTSILSAWRSDLAWGFLRGRFLGVGGVYSGCGGVGLRKLREERGSKCGLRVGEVGSYV